ncbi:MAG: NUDIX domain-containing protein [Chitinophagaceae bacterium]|nr:NUDIX domain-containing protein [Chitinophagaceae bacterium]
MFIKIYFGDKPVFLCDEIDAPLHELMHHPETIFIDELSTPAIHSLLHEISKDEFLRGILWNDNFEKLKRTFFRHFTVLQTGGGLITNEKNEVLMIFRRGKWDLPKGKIEKGETLEECAIREVQEETGLHEIEVGNKITITYHTYHEFGKYILKESHWFNMTCRSDQNLKAQTEEDITDIKWIQQQDLKKYKENTFATILEVLDHLKK